MKSIGQLIKTKLPGKHIRQQLEEGKISRKISSLIWAVWTQAGTDLSPNGFA